MTDLRSTAASRSLTVVLSENDWQALRAVEPDAVGWLQDRIRERIGTPSGDQKQAAAPRPQPANGWDDDLY